LIGDPYSPKEHQIWYPTFPRASEYLSIMLMLGSTPREHWPNKRVLFEDVAQWNAHSVTKLSVNRKISVPAVIVPCSNCVPL
jgi:hypothetical protein